MSPTREPWWADEFDAPEEVDAAFRVQRRLLLRHAVLFGAVVLGIPALSIAVPWWYERPLVGGMTANFLAVAMGLHLLYVTIGLAFARAAARVEQAMLGRRQGWPGEEPPGARHGH